MRKIKVRLLGGLLAAAIMSAGLPVVSMAATKKTETRTPIDMVTINITSYVEAGDEEGHADVETNSTQYSIGNTDWGSIPSNGWNPGDEPKVKIDLHARAGNYFNKTTNKKKVTVNGATFTSAKASDNNETLTVTVKLPPVKGDLGEPEEVEWVGYPLGKGSWKEVPNAGAYELKLYRDGATIFSVEKSMGTTYDFYPQMTQAGTYQFRVRAVPKSTEEEKYLTPGDWVYSDEMDMSDDETAAARYNDGSSTRLTNPGQMGWVEERDGWRYRNADGSYVKNTWAQINNQWYLFGYDGYMLTGWQQHAGNTYYLSGNGVMQTGWLQVNREWYFMNPSDGRMMTGWNMSNGRWYYMNPSTGVMQTGWQLINGGWYYLDPNAGGAMAVNTVVGGYYINGDGIWVQ